MGKLTVAKRNELGRELALPEQKILDMGFIKVGGTNYAKDVEVEGYGILTIRVDVVAPTKQGEGFRAEDLQNEYFAKQQETQAKAQARAEERAKAKAEKEAQKKAEKLAKAQAEVDKLQ